MNIAGVTGFSSPGSIPISTITGDPVARVAADATVADVARALVTADVGAIVVGGKDPASVPATDIASTTLVWCGPGETVDQVAVRMMDHYIRHIMVERDGAPVGIVSARDLLGVYSAYSAEADIDSA